MLKEVLGYLIYVDAKDLKVFTELSNVKKEFKNSLFIQIENEINEIPADGRWYTVGGHYVKIQKK